MAEILTYALSLFEAEILIYALPLFEDLRWCRWPIGVGTEYGWGPRSYHHLITLAFSACPLVPLLFQKYK